jgi:hypothetical protein
MRGCKKACLVVAFLVLAVGVADAQLIVENFDSETTGSLPAWPWWNNGTRSWNSGTCGTILVDESTYRGTSGKSVELVRTLFDGSGFGFGRNFRPVNGPAELTYYFLVGSAEEEVLTVIGGNNADGQVAWWVSVGGYYENAVATYSDSEGWNHVMDVVPDTWYGVLLEIDIATFTYDITVWEDGVPANTVTETGIAFRSGSTADTIDQIQFGNFSDSSLSFTDYAFIDDVTFIGTTVLKDGFESANTSGWSLSTRPRTTVTSCYQTIVTDAVLNADLVCDTGVYESVAVEFGASNITFDLNGYTIWGHPLGIGVRAMDVDGVTIKNGTIQDFLSGLDLVRNNVATVQDLKISNLVEDDPDNFLPALRINRGQGVVVRDSFFEFLPVMHKEAIVLATSEVTIDNIETKDGSVGVNISSDGNESNDGSDATVINSRFVGSVGGAVLVQCTDNSRVADNEFDRNEEAIHGDAVWAGRITGLTIEGNSMHDGYMGVLFMGISGSSILDNVVHDNSLGITLQSNMECLDDATRPDCFYSTGNVVNGNEATDNFLDLHHREYATGNTWVDNICQTKEGAEIPSCTAPAP